LAAVISSGFSAESDPANATWPEMNDCTPVPEPLGL
jgi:hypothetical protein